ncbi:MAG: ABC transporter permease [Actinomycetota bacterium]
MASIPAEHGFELRGERSRLRPLLRDLWRSRDLVVMLARKDFFVRYRRATLGLIWAIGLPLVQAIVYAVVLNQFVRFDTPVDFAVFVFAGVLPWTTFNASVIAGTSSIVEGTALATKIYFPRPVLPFVTVLSGFYGLVPGIVILLIMTAALGNPLGWAVLLMIPAMVLLFLLSAAFALVLAVMQVYSRDVKHVVGAVSLPWFWASGVFYPLSSEVVSDTFRRFLEINPAVGVIQMFRAAIGAGAPGWESALWWTAGWIVVLMAGAAFLYRRHDRVCVDLL